MAVPQTIKDKIPSRFTVSPSQSPASNLLTSFDQPKVAAPSQPTASGLGPLGLVKDVVQGTARTGASVGLTLANKPELAIDPSAPEAEQRIQRILFGDQPVKSLAGRVAETELKAKPIVGEKAALPSALAIVGGLTIADFLPGGKAAKETAKIALSKNVDEISKLIKRLGVADEAIPKLSKDLVKVTDVNEVGKILEAAPKGNVPKFKLGEDSLAQEARKYKSAEEFVNSPKYEYHFSNNPDLKVGDTIKTSHGEGVFTTKTPHTWGVQLNYERGAKAPQELYITEVKNPAVGENAYTNYGHETVSPQGEVKVIGKIGNMDEMFGDKPISIGQVEEIKKSQLTDFYNQAIKVTPTTLKLKTEISNKVADEAINVAKNDPGSGLLGKEFRDPITKERVGGPRLFQRIGDALERGEIDINNLPDYVKTYGLNGEETAKLFKDAATFSGRTLQALSRVEKELRTLLPDMPTVKVELTGWQIFKSKWEAVDNFRRGLLVSQVATAMRNTISQGGRYSLEIVNDAFSGVINKVSGKEDAFGPMIEDIAAIFRRTNPKNLEQIAKVLKENPLESGRLFNTPVGDVALGTKITNTLNSVNRFQEFMYRNLILDAKLHTYARQGNRAINELNSDEIARAVDQALELTFSATPTRNTFFGDLYRAYKAMPFSTILLNPFPRFQMNALKFIIDHSPLGLMSLFSSKTRAAIAAGNPQAISKAITGTLMLSAATVIRNNPNIGGEKWYELKVGNKTIDLRPFAPFSTYLFLAELWSNPERLSGGDFAQAALSINRIAGSGLAVVDLFQQGTPEGTIKFLKEFTGQYLGGFTVPFRSISDVVGQFRPEAAISRDVKEHPIIGPALSNIPGLQENLPEYPSLFEEEPLKREMPLLRQTTGITIKTKPYILKEIDRLGLQTKDMIPKTGDPTINRIITKATGAILDPLNDLIENSDAYQVANDAQKIDIIKTLVSEAKSKAKGDVAKNIAQVIYDELKNKAASERVDAIKKLTNKGLMTENILDFLSPMLEANPLK